jgi:hypothetical protein
MNFFDFRKRDDLIKLPRNLRLLHTQNRAVQKNIFASGQLRMKSGADFQETANATRSFTRPVVGSVTRERILRRWICRPHYGR